MKRKKIFYVIGSPNQTSQMQAINRHLPEFGDYWTQTYSDDWFSRFGIRLGFADQTIIWGEIKKKGDKFLKENRLRNDYRGRVYKQDYDLVIACNDLVMPRKVRATKSVWIQEGMIDELTPWARKVKQLNKWMKLPRYMAFNTSLNGSSNECDIYCVASEGYKEHLVKMGTDVDKIIVTGAPNFDNAAAFLDNDFPHKNYVLVCTSDIREVYRNEDRPAFIKQCVKIASGRPLIFKLHPNEKFERAKAEIEEYAPESTLVFQNGNTNAMIANCEELITQYSTVVYIGIALGKKVHSFFDVELLKRLTPVQNGGTSAKKIADICREFIDFEGSGPEFLKQYQPPAPEARIPELEPVATF